VISQAASAAPTDTGGGSAYVTSTFNVTPLQGLQAAAGAGTTVSYTQGLPTDTSLSPIPSSDLPPSYASTGYGGMYTGTLTAPETGIYVLAFQNPGTPPVSTYSVGVNLVAGPDVHDPAVRRRPMSDDTESEAADQASLNLPSAQNELISAVAAANPHTVVVIDAGAPVIMPWLSQVASVVDAGYPGESNGTALASVLFGQTDPSGHLPVTFPTDLSQVPASSPSEFPGTDGQVLYSEGIDVGYRYYDANNETPLFPFGYGLSYTSFSYSHLRGIPGQVQNATSDPGFDQLQLQRAGQRPGHDFGHGDQHRPGGGI
jgi:beta-glucosidase